MNLANVVVPRKPSPGTAPLLYSAADVRRYAEQYFPAEELWSFYMYPLPATYEEKMHEQAQAVSKVLHNEFRDWRFGELNKDIKCYDAARFRELYSQSVSGRYDAGAIRLGPLEILTQTPALNKPFVVDFDANDYKEFREICKCSQAKEKMCLQCVEVVRVAARVVVNILEQVYNFKRVYCSFSGARGLHIRVLDYMACCLDDGGRTSIADTLKRAPTIPGLSHLCTPLVALEARLGMSLGIKIDYKVSKETGKLTRGLFSIHPKTGRLSVPLANPEAFMSVEVSPMIATLLTLLPANPPQSWVDARRLLEQWTTAA